MDIDSVRHLLADKDVVARTAACSVCGAVSISPINGGRSWVCENKKRESAAAWRAANPEKVAATRRRKSPHHLTEWDPQTGLAHCPIDGWVPRQAVPRGWMCSVRAAQMGRTLDSTQVPDERCRVCEHFGSAANPLVDGLCSYHRERNWGTASLPHAPGTHFRYDEDVERALDILQSGGRSVALQAYETTTVPARESAVPGWRMAGENVPRSEWEKWNDLLTAEGL